MVQDIRPGANALLKQLSGLPQRNTGTIGNKPNNVIMNREPRVESRVDRPVAPADRAVNRIQMTRETLPQTPLAKSGRSVVEEVFNQMYSNSGFLEEEEPVTFKGEPLGSRLDVYA